MVVSPVGAQARVGLEPFRLRAA